MIMNSAVSDGHSTTDVRFFIGIMAEESHKEGCAAGQWRGLVHVYGQINKRVSEISVGERCWLGSPGNWMTLCDQHRDSLGGARTISLLHQGAPMLWTRQGGSQNSSWSFVLLVFPTAHTQLPGPSLDVTQTILLDVWLAESPSGNFFMSSLFFPVPVPLPLQILHPQ